MPSDEDLEKGPAGPPNLCKKLETLKGKDWKENLDASFHGEVLDICSGVPDWKELDLETNEDLFKPPESVEIRLFLIEGVTEEIRSRFSGFDDSFFKHHILNVLPFNWSGFGENLFFGKWFRRVYQNHEQRFIEERLSRGRPYNSDRLLDPRKLHLDHERYARALCIPRPFSSLEPYPKGENDTRVAIAEGASACFRKEGDATIGLVLFDAPRQVYVDHIRFESGKEIPSRTSREHFSHFTPCYQRFKDQLQHPSNLDALKENTKQSVKDIILRFILDDHMEIMDDFRNALDFIEEHLSDDHVLRECLQTWRVLLGQWKRNLSNDISSMAYAAQTLLYEPGIGGRDRIAIDDEPKALRRTNSVLHPPSQGDFDNVTKGVENLARRAESTFHLMTSTMAIVESREAIAQAAIISNLTNLAFVFIPLTLTASIFGMNIVEWNSKLKMSYWIIASVSVLLITYMVLYHKHVTTGLSWSAESVQRLHINQNARRISRSAHSLESYSKQFCLHLTEGFIILVTYSKQFYVFLAEGFIFLVIVSVYVMSVIAPIAGWIAAIWAISVKTSLPGDSKVAVGVGVGLGIPFLACLWALILLNKREECLRRPALITFPCLLLGLGIGIWAVLKHSPLPYDEKVRVVVGMGVGGPCVFLLWILTLRHFANSAPLLTVIFLIVFIPTLWAMAIRSPWDKHARVSVCLGLGYGLPCLIMILMLLFGPYRRVEIG